MDLRNKIMAWGLVLGLASCSAPAPEEAQDTGWVDIRFTLVETKSTGVDDSSGLQFKWENGDKLYVYDGTQCCGTIGLSSGAGTTQATFAGQIKKPQPTDGSISLYYFGKDLTPAGDSSVSADYHSQPGTLEYLSGHLIARASCSYTQGQTSLSGVLSPVFATAKYQFSSSTAKLHFTGFAKGIKVSSVGDVEYVSPEEKECSIELSSVDASKDYYIIFPIKESDSFTVVNENGEFLSGSGIANGKYYCNEDGSAQQLSLHSWASDSEVYTLLGGKQIQFQQSNLQLGGKSLVSWNEVSEYLNSNSEWSVMDRNDWLLLKNRNYQKDSESYYQTFCCTLVVPACTPVYGLMVLADSDNTNGKKDPTALSANIVRNIPSGATFLPFPSIPCHYWTSVSAEEGNQYYALLEDGMFATNYNKPKSETAYIRLVKYLN